VTVLHLAAAIVSTQLAMSALYVIVGTIRSNRGRIVRALQMER